MERLAVSVGDRRETETLGGDVKSLSLREASRRSWWTSGSSALATEGFSRRNITRW